MTGKTDRALIELAARAANIKGEWQRNTAFIQERYDYIIPYDNQGLMSSTVWNPLREDGDAFRLLVKIGGNLSQDNPGYAKVSYGPFEDYQVVVVQSKNDYERATREVIVRAAAAIGEKMP